MVNCGFSITDFALEIGGQVRIADGESYREWSRKDKGGQEWSNVVRRIEDGEFDLISD